MKLIATYTLSLYMKLACNFLLGSSDPCAVQGSTELYIYIIYSKINTYQI